MKPLDYIRTASKNIMRQKLRTGLTIFAIMIGATSVTIMLALVTGAKDFFNKQFEQSGALQQVAVSPQATDLNTSTAVKLTDDLAAKIKKISHVTGLSRVTSPLVFDSISFKDNKLSVRNVQAQDFNGVKKTDLVAGRDLNEGDGANTIILTSDYADRLGFKGNYNALVGQKVNMVTQAGFSGVGATIPAPVRRADGRYNAPQTPPATTFTPIVAGVISGTDSGTIYMTNKWAHDLMTEQHYNLVDGNVVLETTNRLDKDGYNGFTVQVDKTSNAEGVAGEIRNLGVGAITAQSFIKQQTQIFNIIGYVLGGIGAISLAVAAVGVINTMVMAMLERTREIGIMRAIGARRSTVRNLFTIEAATIGFWGGVLGVAVAYGLTRLANIFINQQLSANAVKSSDIIGMPIWLILGVIGVTTLIGTLAGLYPAFRAARLNPVDALRYE